MSFALKNFSCLPVGPYFGPREQFYLMKKPSNRITIEVWFRASFVYQISSASAIIDPNFCQGLADRALKLCSVLAELEDFCLIHVFQQPLRCFTESVDLLRLALFLVLMGFKLLDQLGDCLSFSFILLLNRWEIYLGFGSPRCCNGSPGSFALGIVFPKMILFFDWVDLVIHIAHLLWAQHVVTRFLFDKGNPCLVFMHTAFSMNSASGVS